MAITFFGVATVPADNSAQAGPTVTLTPPGSMVAGDLVMVSVRYRATGSGTITNSVTGGQTWNATTQYDTTLIRSRIFWCTYNGSWPANPAFTVTSGTNNMDAQMLVFRPTLAGYTWSLEAGPTTSTYTAPTTPFLVSITGRTTTAPSTVTVAVWHSIDDNTWGTLAGSGWSQTGLTAQYRNNSSQDNSSAFAYNIRTTAGAVANVSLNQTGLGGDDGSRALLTFAESITNAIATPLTAAATPTAGSLAKVNVVTGIAGVSATASVGTLVGGPFVIVQQASGGDVTGSDVTSMATSAFNLTAGRTVVVCCRPNASFYSITAVNDTAGNTFLPLTERGGGTSDPELQIWYCVNCLGHAANVVTATLNAPQPYVGIEALEIVGTNALDAEGGGQTPFPHGGTPSSPAFSTVAANTFCVAFIGQSVGVTLSAAGGGYTLLDTGPGIGISYKYVPTAATVATPSYTSDSGNVGAVAVASFKYIVVTNATATPAGVAATASAGTTTAVVLASATATPSGVATTASAGSLAVSSVYTATGAQATASAGTVAVASASALTGVAATASAGTVTTATICVVPVVGVAATASAGTTTVSLVANVTATTVGVSATASAGVAVGSPYLIVQYAVGSTLVGDVTSYASAAFNLTAGRTVVVGARGTAFYVNTSCTDTAGNTYVPLTARGGESSGPGSPEVQIFYCLNCLGHASNVVTIAMNGGNPVHAIAVLEIVGANALDTDGGGEIPFPHSGNPSSPAFSTVAANTFCVAFIGQSESAVITAAGGYTLLDGEIPDGDGILAVSYKLVPTAATVATPSYTSTSGNVGAVAVASFKFLATVSATATPTGVAATPAAGELLAYGPVPTEPGGWHPEGWQPPGWQPPGWQPVVTVTNATASAIGVASTASAGTLVVVVGGIALPLTVAATAAAGTVATVATAAPTLTGASSSVSAGTITVAAGTVTHASTTPVGASSTTAAGVLGTQTTHNVLLVGVASTVAAGTASAAGQLIAAPGVAGVQATASAGSALVQTLAVVVPSGASTTANAGTLTAAGSGQAAAAVTGVAATASAGTLGVASKSTLTGAQATAQAGTITPQPATQAVVAAGATSTASAGVLTVQGKAVVVPSTATVTPSAGSLAAVGSGQAVALLTGVAATAAVGTLSLSSKSTLTGAQATALAGTTIGYGSALGIVTAGVSSTASAGTVATRTTVVVIPSTATATLFAGSIAATGAGQAVALLSGVTATAAAGTLAVVANARVNVTGVAATAQIGTLVAAPAALGVVTGVSSSATAGTITCRWTGTAWPSTATATATVGTLAGVSTGQAVAVLSGVSAQGQVGTCAIGSGVQLQGVAAIASAGVLVSGIGVQLVGVSATARAGNAVGGAESVSNVTGVQVVSGELRTARSTSAELRAIVAVTGELRGKITAVEVEEVE